MSSTYPAQWLASVPSGLLPPIFFTWIRPWETCEIQKYIHLACFDSQKLHSSEGELPTYNAHNN